MPKIIKTGEIDGQPIVREETSAERLSKIVDCKCSKNCPYVIQEKLTEMTIEEAEKLFYKTHSCEHKDIDDQQRVIDEWIINEGITII